MMKLSREIILETLSEHAHKVRALGVVRLGLFGSAARDEIGEHSDLDFLVVLRKKSFDSYMDLKFFLEDTFERKVDLVLENTLKPRLEPYIREEVIHVEGF
jgi:uncharacterized protein